jgi:hypothetical protein
LEGSQYGPHEVFSAGDGLLRRSELMMVEDCSRIASLGLERKVGYLESKFDDIFEQSCVISLSFDFDFILPLPFPPTSSSFNVAQQRLHSSGASIFPSLVMAKINHTKYSSDSGSAYEDASERADTDSEATGPATRAQSSSHHQNQLGLGEDVATQQGSVPQPRGLVDQPDEMVQSIQGKSGPRQSRSRKASSSKPSKSECEQSRSSQSRQKVDPALTKEYREMLNKMIEDVHLGDVELNAPLDSSQIGASFWTAGEKERLFQALNRRGLYDLPSLCRAVRTKSIYEIQNYLSLLQQGCEDVSNSVTTKKDFSLSDIPAAVEISEECQSALDTVADVLSARVEKSEASAARTQFGDDWLIDEGLAEKEEREYEEHTASNSEAIAQDDGSGDDVSKPPSTDSTHLARLLRPIAFLELSRNIFMNHGEQECLNWHHVERIAGEPESPAIYRSAYDNLQDITVSLTRRLVQAVIFQAMTRLRTGDSSRSDWTPLAAVREIDVQSAVNLLGMKKDSRRYWVAVPKRYHLGVYTDSKHYKDGRPGTKSGCRLTDAEVEAELGLSTSKDLHGREEEILDVFEEDVDEVLSDDDLFTDGDVSEMEMQPPDTVPGKSRSGSSRMKRKRPASPEELAREEGRYLECLDRAASAQEEDQLWKMVRVERSGVQGTPGTMPPRVEVRVAHPTQPSGDLRDLVYYEGDWEQSYGCPSAASFDEMEIRGQGGRKRRRILARKVAERLRLAHEREKSQSSDSNAPSAAENHSQAPQTDVESVVDGDEAEGWKSEDIDT